MAFLLGLFSITFFLFLLAHIFHWKRLKSLLIAARYATTIMFVQVGMMHLINPAAFTHMIEGFLPFPKLLVLFSGITEIILGLGLLFYKTRILSTWLLLVQLILMFPANIYVACHRLSPPGGLPAEEWYTWSRLLFQPVYMLWVYKVGSLGVKNRFNASFFNFLRHQ